MSGAASRAAAARSVAAVVAEGRALPDALAAHGQKLEQQADRAFAQHLAYAALRWRWRSEWLLRKLLKKPIKASAAPLHGLFLVAVEEIHSDPQRAHAIVNEAVSATRILGFNWASGLMNGVLRRLLREHDTLDAQLQGDDVARTAHPPWLLSRLKQDWPRRWPAICTANNQPPPFWLRINQARVQPSDYIKVLESRGIDWHRADDAPEAVRLTTALPVDQLPGFNAGQVSVQDAAAQLCAGVVAAEPGMRVLDACAAPGGKAAHLLERTPDLDLTAVEIDEQRAPLIRQTLDRLGLAAEVITADAAEPDIWWDQQPYDRILLDAPCSATGVIRRHPDIKSLRRDSDIRALVKLQARLLDRLWPLLKPGGMLVYATCSVLSEENDRQLQAFLERQTDATCLPIQADWGHGVVADGHEFGRQILPGDAHRDGFFYARLGKAADAAAGGGDHQRL